MQNIHYITAEDILSVIEKLTYDDIVITDNYTVKEIAQKYNNQCKQVYHYSRKSLHQQIEHFKPSVVILLFNSQNTIAFINSICPDITIYTIKLSKDEERINFYVEELENISV